ncbi:MAG: sulfatase-like hydrolase/transferase [Acholeplasmatales bacterium]|nr:sulfatase-like hydrolase/transferase [Acholeplasmatales bacterium]
MKKKLFLNWISENRIVLMYVFISIVIELMSVFYVDKSIIITKPWIGLGFLVAMAGLIGLVKNNLARYIIGIVSLFAQFLICIIFSLVYDMNGQYFTYELLQLRNDAFGILETLPVNFFLFFIPVTLMIVFTVLSFKLHFIIKSKSRVRLPLTISLLVFGLVLSNVSIVVTDIGSNDRYYDLVNAKGTSIYSEYGFTGNFVNQLVKGTFFNKIDKMSQNKIKSYVYYNQLDDVYDDSGIVDSSNQYYINELNDYSGLSEGNNVITILAESLEWFGIADSPEYPHNLRLTECANVSNFETRLKDYLEKEVDDYDYSRLTDIYDFSTWTEKSKIYEYIFPNLYKYFINSNNSIVFDQFHSKEKTDVSESLSIVGSYPTTGYINYNYNKNTIPTTVPNMMRYDTESKNMTVFTANSYHNGQANFYNRNKTHTSAFGMDSFSASEKLYDYGMTNYIVKGERNLDSELIEAGIKERNMFPIDGRRFYTYITSITMHGMYYPRENLKEYRAVLRTLCPEGTTKKFGTDLNLENNVLDYMTTIMEFDKAIGIMMDYLQSHNILKNTTIALFGDHNAYYSSISNDVKEIQNYNVDCYSNLFHVPFLMYDENVGKSKTEPTVIDKFLCTFDIAPTIIDLLGIRYFNNFYYGHSGFSKEESIIYSRSYDFFVAKGIHARSLSYILSKGKNITDNDLVSFKEKGVKLVDKIEYSDQLFTQNFFDKSSLTNNTYVKNLTDYYNKLDEIQ